ncbi:MAG: class I SAM-dependent methyltransferase, partial [Bacilli bacterium]|nr:class I SAM-dependent methyltransferase [Bacilli bacterium]
EKTSNYANLRLIRSDFKKIDSYVKAADAIMFNLGFLPGSNKKIKTSDYDTAEAILKAYDILNLGGIMSIACYTKHEGGSEEFLEIKAALEKANIDFKLHNSFENEEILIEIRR